MPVRLSVRLGAYVSGMALALLCTLSGAQVAVPALSAHVTDLTATLQTPQRDALEAKLVALEQRKGAQLAVLIVPTTQPETIEQYAIRVFDAWKIGRKGVDDGVLLLVAKSDRKVRIEVGRGLEGAVPDVIARRIIDEYLTPHFREGDFFGGIDAATSALQKLIDGESLPMPYRSDGDGSMDDKALLFTWLMLSAILSVFLGGLRWPLRLPVVGGISAVVMAVLGVEAPMFVFAGIGSALMSLFMNNSGRAVAGGNSSGWSSGGLSSSGSSGGGWSSGSSSSSSSWSGGGGSSAGGGASGSW